MTVDSRLLAAMRLEGNPTGQREIALDTTFSPRQIQARLRSGATVSDLADEFGVPIEKVERFSGPPLADRAFTADQARRAVIASHLGERPLDTVVATAVEASGVEPDTIRWDAWLREDGLWQVLSSYPSGTLDQVATWVFDPRETTVRADDDTARLLLAGPDQRQPSAKASRRVSPAATDADPASAPGTQPQIDSVRDFADGPADASVVAAIPDKVPSTDSTNAVEPAVESDEPPAPSRQAKRGRRASVPTWDEILFGSSEHDADPAT